MGRVRTESREIAPQVSAHTAPSAVQFRKRRGDVTARVVADECVLLDRDAGLVHQFNLTASFIWDRCDAWSTVEEIAARMAERFDVDPGVARVDVAAVVRQLLDLNLLDTNG
jgi:hypothetical protein